MSLFTENLPVEPFQPRKAAHRIRKDAFEISQPELIRPALEECVPGGCAARWILACVMSLELSLFSEPSQGGAGYDPRRMLGLWLLALHDRLGSSRQIERFLSDPQYLYVMGGNRPDHSTICRFRRRLGSVLPKLMALSVERARNLGLAELRLASLDGTRMAGNVSQWSKALKKVRLCDDEDEPPSDPDARLQKTPRGFVKGYNAQAMVDAQSGLVVGGYVTNACTDQEQMEPALESCRQMSGRHPQALAADGGYSTSANAARLDSRGVLGFVPAHHATDWTQNEDGELQCRCGSKEIEASRQRHNGKPIVRHKCSICKSTFRHPESAAPGSWLGMIERGRTSQATQMQAVRRQTIERLFSLTKHRYGLSRFTLRGLEGANIQWLLVLLIRNMALEARATARFFQYWPDIAGFWRNIIQEFGQKICIVQKPNSLKWING